MTAAAESARRAPVSGTAPPMPRAAESRAAESLAMESRTMESSAAPVSGKAVSGETAEGEMDALSDVTVTLSTAPAAGETG